jgi:hypothetical protein
MTVRTVFVSTLALFAMACIVDGGGDGHGHGGGGNSEAEARAEKRCEREAEDRGLRVRNVSNAEKVGKKQYEVRLKVDERQYYDDKQGKKKKGDEVRVLCRYDDKDRRATLY